MSTSSEPLPGGRAPTAERALETAVRVAKRACARVETDTLESYLANQERQESVERLLLRFGEALKALPLGLLQTINPAVEWDKPLRFRDLAAHWYEDGLDHQLIWNVLKRDLPPLITVLEACVGSQSDKA